jgi:hypothetical protein
MPKRDSMVFGSVEEQREIRLDEDREMHRAGARSTARVELLRPDAIVGELLAGSRAGRQPPTCRARPPASS